MINERTRTFWRRAMTFLFAGVSIVYLLARLAHPTPVHAHEGLVHEGCDPAAIVTSGALTVSGAFSRAMLPNAPAAGGYLTIANSGTGDDTLVGATTEAAGRIELHQMSMVGDVMKMSAVENGITVPAGGSVTLEPGGLHLMFLDVGTPFAEGECVAVTLDFASGVAVPVMLAIGAINAAEPPDHAGHGD
jgi:copper(I)-binding protein